ncbi:ATPase/histidine kinase/DNA gyrase B/HSP90 domain protein [Capnocytophaga sp. oral taxon 863 str. F0517]|uniref:sensor histidine kinase n=1 Tax=Capnocytophaga sp. oral taxon 863 TaxID=1227265 RepID=UPI00039729B6|nr:HAMP domain-containing sensor histidine kinase [Capnocytophaga sp. oral taxon 863]ERI63107.1 ATPase/histidine kinase/DNA gyrase B/HSP90 domain protein [Capnocytophaga sp. oral taxon 863 str. F0517]
MNKRSYIVALILMPIALIGLISIQFYWVKSSIDNKEEAFTHSVQQTLNSVSESVELREINRYITRFIELKGKDSLGSLKSSQIRDLVFVQENKNTKETFTYKHQVLEEGYKVPSELFNLPKGDTTQIRNYVSKQTSRTFGPTKGLDGQRFGGTTVEEKTGRITSFDKAMFEELFREVSAKLSIEDRITTSQLDVLLERELRNRGLNLDFEFAIYDTSKPQGQEKTSIASQKFDPKAKNIYTIPLLRNQQGDSHYLLEVHFPDRQRYLLSSVIMLAIWVCIFTAIIIWAFAKTFIQMRTQKQINEIKTDFINNMTHEFKTPIATINLALDAMKNPQVMSDMEKMSFYLKMLRDENKRMHAHVENVLQISKLDKNQVEIEKEPLDAHELIENAVAHVQLLIEDRKGKIKKHLHAENSDILANEMHFTNVIVNILENAIKYSSEAPDIDVFTEVAHNKLVIRIQDKGQGMSKAVLKKIFEKFYREHTGDLHNVKGHGLGLAYVKRIVKYHDGEVYAESEKGKGSTFVIKVPLII